MIESLLFVTLGLALLVAGGEALVRSASKIAASLNISPLIIGLTVVAFGTSAPELGVSLFAAIQGKPEIALTNVVGSNIFNIGFILGVCALISPLIVNLQLIKFDVPVLIAASFLAYLFCFDEQLTQIEGAVLFLGLLAYTFWLIRASRKESKQLEQEFEKAFVHRSNSSLLTPSLLTLLSLAVLVAGSRLLVLGSSDLAKTYGVSESLIGLTIVAAGTSLPEVALSIMATIRGQTDIAIGNVIGSNIFNLLLILGLSSGIKSTGLSVDQILIQADLPVMVGMTLLSLPLLFTTRKLVRWEGALLLSSYILYTVFLIKRG